MRTKRFLATLLCLAMILTSGTFTNVVFAAEPEETPVVTNEEVSLEDVVSNEISDDELYTEETSSEENRIDEESEEGEIDIVDSSEQIADIDEEAELTIDGEEEIISEETSMDAEIDDLQLTASVIPSPAFENTPGELALADPSLLTESVTLPEGITSIPDDIFSKGSPACGIVKTIVFSDPDSFETIAPGAFLESSVTTINLGYQCVDIPENAFKGSNIENINMGYIENIGDSAFEDCKKLTRISLKNVETIGKKAFKNASLLNSVSFDKCQFLSVIGEEAFEACSLTNIDLSNDLVNLTVEARAFSGNTSLTSAVFPPSLVSIPDSMFENCTKLQKFQLPYYSITDSVGKFAFRGCTALTTVSLREYVKSVGNQAFYGCSKLVTVSFYEPTGDVEFDDSAFELGNTTTTIKGYDGKVQAYAQNKGYKFVSMNTSYPIVKYEPKSGIGKVVPKVASAKEGEIVYLTVVPGTDYTLLTDKLAVRIDGDWDAPKIIPKLYSSTSKSQVFTFEMPKGKAIICNIDDTDKKTNALFTTCSKCVKGDLKLVIDSEYYDQQQNKLVFPRTGYSAQLSLSDVYDNYSHPVGIWNFSIKSSDQNVVAVTSMGVITALKRGTANIVITAIGCTTKKISFTVTVGDSVVIKTASFAPYFSRLKGQMETLGLCEVDNASYIYEPGEEYNNTEYYVIEFPVDKIKTVSQEFFPEISAYKEEIADVDEHSRNLLANSSWTISDKNIVTLGSTTSNENKNKITVKKSSYGEVFVSATIKNEDGTTVSDGFIIRVMNPAPRLHVDEIAINKACSGGTLLNMTEVYGYVLDPTSLEVCIMEKGVLHSAKETTTGSAKYFELINDTDGIHIYATQYLSVKDDAKVNYKPSTFYIRGKAKKTIDDTGVEIPVTFSIPLPKIVVTKSVPKVKLKTTGKINTFYNANKENNYITVKHGVKNVEIDLERGGVEFISKANYKAPGSEEEDSFAWPFIVTPLLDNSGFTVALSGKPFKRDANDQAILAGIVRIWFKGYNAPFCVNYTVPTGYAPPSYALSIQKASASYLFENAEYKVKLLDKKKNELALVDKDSGDPLYTMLAYNDAKTIPGIFDSSAIEENVQTNEVTFRMIGDSRNATAYILLQMNDWARPIQYQFSIFKVGIPVATLKPSSVTLNPLAPSQVAPMEFTYNQQGILIQDVEDIVFTGSRKNDDFAQAGDDLADAMELDDKGRLECKLPTSADETFPQGTYTFKCSPVVSFVEGGETFKLNPVAFKVVVKRVKPVFKLKTATFTLNAKYANLDNVGTDTREFAETITSVGGVPKGSKFTLDTTGVTCEPVKATYPVWSDLFTIKAVNPEDDSNDAPKIRISLTKQKYLTSFTYDYILKGLGLNVNGDLYVVDGLRIRIKGVYTNPSIKIKTTGSLNQVDPLSVLKNKITVSGINGTISETFIKEVNRKTNVIYKDDSDEECSYHFESAPNPEIDNVIDITLNQEHILDEDDTDPEHVPDPLENNATYLVWLFYKLNETGDTWHTYPTQLKIVPKQVLPKLIVQNNAGDIVVGQNYESRTITFFIAQDTVRNAIPVDTPELLNTADGVRLYPTVRESTKKAIKVADVVSYDANGERFYLRDANDNLMLDSKKEKRPGSYITTILEQAAMVQGGLSYSVPYEIRFKNQNKKTTGVKVNVSMKIIK